MSYAITLVLQRAKIVSEDFEQFVQGITTWLEDSSELPPESEHTAVYLMIQTQFGKPILFTGITSYPFRAQADRGWIDWEQASVRQFRAGQGDSWIDLTPDQIRTVAEYLKRLSPEAWRRSPEVRIPLTGTQYRAS
ncbi:MAG: hypothetical protein HY331_11675 [Chloroflexi bacterium]|nr:hypothetical protein [Chloroflexota bacterium]